MQIAIMRHGATTANEKHQYAGVIDVPLTELGEQQALDAGTCPQVDTVYVSPLQRARRTAQLCFPNARQVVVDDLREMDFGVFEGRSAKDMEHDPEYRAWVDSMCMDRCPGGEIVDELTARVAAAVTRIVREASERNDELVVVVGHGGTVMAAMDALAEGERAYFEWHVGNCEGYRADVVLEDDGVRLANWERFATLDFLGAQDSQDTRQPCEQGEFFFQNLKCPHFPCHTGVDKTEFNCLFCYCPLYALGSECGGNFVYTKKGYKNCVNCVVPHVRDTGAALVKERFKELAELAKRR